MPILRENSKFEVHGSVHPGFEPVLDLFANNFKRGLETTAQCCAYVGSQKVVDLYGKLKEKQYQEYNADSLAIIFSSTKCITSIVFATLVDKKLLNYTDRVAKHWPEFAQNGKEDLTIDKIMRHESGLAKVNWDISPEAFFSENIRKNSLGKSIEQEKLRYPDLKHGTDRQYHGLSRGIILNEIFRRVEPKQRTVGQYLKQEISKPMELDLYIGLDDSDRPRLRPLESWSLSKVVFHSMLPDILGSKIEASTLGYLGSLVKIYKFAKPRKFFPWESEPVSLVNFDVWNKEWSVKGELPSSCGIASARGLAFLAGIMANKGEMNGYRVMSEETWEELHGDPITKKDVAQNIPGLSPTIMTRGGLTLFQPIDGEDGRSREVRRLREGYYGWYGMGGSVFQWHPRLKIGFAYVPTLMAWYDNHNKRGAHLQQKVAECAAASFDSL